MILQKHVLSFKCNDFFKMVNLNAISSSATLSREWRCSWSSADRRCSNYIWVMDNFIALQGASYIRDLTVSSFLTSHIAQNWQAFRKWMLAQFLSIADNGVSLVVNNEVRYLFLVLHAIPWLPVRVLNHRAKVMWYLSEDHSDEFSTEAVAKRQNYSGFIGQIQRQGSCGWYLAWGRSANIQNDLNILFVVTPVQLQLSYQSCTALSYRLSSYLSMMKTSVNGRL